MRKRICCQICPTSSIGGPPKPLALFDALPSYPQVQPPPSLERGVVELGTFWPRVPVTNSTRSASSARRPTIRAICRRNGGSIVRLSVRGESDCGSVGGGDFAVPSKKLSKSKGGALGG